MIALSGLAALNNAQNLLSGASGRIAQGQVEPQNFVDLLQAREQSSAGVKMIQTGDEITKTLLDVFG